MENQGKNEKKLAGVPLRTYGMLLAAVVILGAAALFAWPQYKLLQSKQGEEIAVTGAREAALAGEFAAAKEEAYGALESIDPYARANARRVYNVATFLSGTEADRLEAIRMVKAQYELVGQGEQAGLINLLIGFNVATFEPKIAEATFAGSPFQELYVEGDLAASLKNLAQRSISMYPTDEALFHAAAWEAAQILSAGTETPRQELMEHARLILDYIAQARALPPEPTENDASTFATMGDVNRLASLAYLYTAVGAVRPVFQKQAEKSYAAIYALYDGAKDDNGAHDPLFTVWMPRVHFNHALLLYYVGNEERFSVAAEHLDTAAAMVEADPSLHQRVFLAYIDAARAVGSGQHYEDIVAAASLSPSFKRMLESRGWTFASE